MPAACHSCLVINGATCTIRSYVAACMHDTMRIWVNKGERMEGHVIDLNQELATPGWGSHSHSEVAAAVDTAAVGSCHLWGAGATLRPLVATDACANAGSTCTMRKRNQ